MVTLTIVFVLRDSIHHRLFILCWERGSRGVKIFVAGEITLRRGKKKFDTEWTSGTVKTRRGYNENCRCRHIGTNVKTPFG